MRPGRGGGGGGKKEEEEERREGGRGGKRTWSGPPITQTICFFILSAICRWGIYSRKIFIGILLYLPSKFRGGCKS